jgi:ketosteroid isomerase-like protein
VGWGSWGRWLGAGLAICVVTLGCQALPVGSSAQTTTSASGSTVASAATAPTTSSTATAEPTLALNLPSSNAAPVAVALHFDALLNAGDVEGTLALFDQDAQVKVPPDLYRNQAQIRDWITYLAANHFASEPGLRHVNGDTVTWSAQVRSDQLMRFGLGILNGEATLVVRDDRISSYTFVLTEESAAQLRAAQLAASEVLQDPLVVGLDTANVYGPKDVFRTADGTLVSYRDVVGAEPGAGPFYDLGGQPVTIRTGI